METQEWYAVYGVDESGFDWQLPTAYVTFEEANARAEREAESEVEVWVEKHTLTREIVKSISGSSLPDNPALIPA